MVKLSLYVQCTSSVHCFIKVDGGSIPITHFWGLNEVKTKYWDFHSYLYVCVFSTKMQTLCRYEMSFFLILIYLFFYFWLCWVFVSVRGLSLVVASGGHSSSRCAGLSPSRPLLLRSTGSSHAGSVVVAHGPSCSAACGIFPDQSSNPCPLH